MHCEIAQNSLSAHLDGGLSSDERQAILTHLGTCPDCDLRLRQLARVRGMLRALPPKTPPAHLTDALRVVASRERARVLARQSPLDQWRDRLRLFSSNVMRPWLLPLAGGLCATLVLFSMVMPSMRLRTDALINDIPAIVNYTGPTVEWQSPWETSYEADFTIAVVVDGEGRAVDYSALPGGDLPQDAAWRRKIQTDLLYMKFTPPRAYGKPTIGTTFLSFTRSSIEVPGRS